MPTIVKVMTAKAVEALTEPGMHAVGGVTGAQPKLRESDGDAWAQDDEGGIVSAHGHAAGVPVLREIPGEQPDRIFQYDTFFWILSEGAVPLQA